MGTCPLVGYSQKRNAFVNSVRCVVNPPSVFGCRVVTVAHVDMRAIPSAPNGKALGSSFANAAVPSVLPNVVLRKSIPVQILHISNNKGYVVGCVLKLTFAIRLHEHFL